MIFQFVDTGYFCLIYLQRTFSSNVNDPKLQIPPSVPTMVFSQSDTKLSNSEI